MRRSKHEPSAPEAVERAYELWLWLEERVVSFPAASRASVGARITGAAVDVMDLTLKVAYAPRNAGEREVHLRGANQRVALIERLDAIGRMIGGWLRHEGRAR